MLTVDKFESHAARLVDPAISDEARRVLAAEVRDAIEVVHSQDYGAFLIHFLPAFVKVLTNITKPQTEDNSVHKTRAIILEVMHRLPHNDVLKESCHQLLPLAMNVMQTDNEENSVTAIHIVFDLHKTFRPHLESQVEPFLSFVRQLYSNLGKTVDAVLRPPNAQLHRPRILMATQSFKVITECPLVVMFVFQLYPKCIRANINALLPLMLKAIQIEIPANQEHAVPKASYKEFIAAQVKTVTFLVYLLKQVPNLMNFDEAWIPQSVVQLLKACPGDAFTIRKELLVATRHMLGSPYRKGFFSRIDSLLDERVIAGTGRASTDALRPLGYAFLAELIHGVRFELKLHQLSRIISMFSTNLHDPGFTFALQTNAVRLLLNLVEGILRLNSEPTNPAARQLLVRIMKTMVAKYVTIGDQVPRLLKAAREAQERTCSLESRIPLSEQPMGDPMKEINDCKNLLKTLTLGLKTVVWSVINIGVVPRSAPEVPKNIAGYAALKASAGGKVEPTVAGKPTNQKPAGAPEAESTLWMGLLEEESELITQLLPASQKCFKLYSGLEQRGSGRSSSSGDSRYERKSTAPGEKEILDQFAQIFTILSVQSFQDVFGLRMPELLEYIMDNPAAIAIVQLFLANSNISKYFADILLNFAVTKMSILGVPRPKHNAEQTVEQKRAYTLLRLFKSLFASVPNFNMNEPVLRLHVGTIVRECLSHASKCEDPYNYLQLLRALFKSLTSGSGKHDMQFDSLFRDFMPLVEPLLSGLLRLYNGPHRLAHKDLIIELCLIIPARPSTLFPYLELQMKPIVWALTGSNDNMTFGLRALEFWLELLQPDYFEKLLQTVEPDLSLALQSHLRQSQSNQFSTTALRILGKLGARSRKYSGVVKSPSSRAHSEPALQFQLAWSGISGAGLDLNSDDLAERATDLLLSENRASKSSGSMSQKQSAWEFCKICLAPFLGLQGNHGDAYADASMQDDMWTVLSSNVSSGSENWVERLQLQLPVSEEARRAAGVRPRTRARYGAEMATIRKLLVAIICAGALPDFEHSSAQNLSREATAKKESPRRFAFGLTQYFAMLLGRQSSKPTAADALSIDEEAKGFAAPSIIEPSIFLDALVEAMSRERRDHREAGLLCLKQFVDSVMCFSGCVRPGKENQSHGKSLSTGELQTATLRNKMDLDISTSGNQDKRSKLSAESPATSRVDFPASLNSPRRNTAVKAERKSPKATEGEILGGKGEAQQKTGVSTSDENSLHAVSACTTVLKQEDIQMKEPEESKASGSSPNLGGTTSTGHSVIRDVEEGNWVIPSAISSIIERFCHHCYKRSWCAKWAGAAGLGAIIGKVPSQVFRIRESPAYEAHVVRALMFVVRDLSDDVSYLTTKIAKTSLEKLLIRCHQLQSAGSPQSKAKGLRDVSMCLAVELISDSTSARDVAKEAFRILSRTLNMDLADIMAHIKEQILRPLQQRSIRQLPFPVQIGLVDAVSFCLQLERPVLSTELFSPPLKNLFLIDVINIPDDPTFEKLTEAEDGLRHKLVENKLIHTDVVEHLAQLRRLSVELLSNVAVRCAKQLQEPANDELFRKMISIFFKCLQSRDKDLVATAKTGLKQAISQHQKPKETLQRNLRPVLSNLSDYKKLSLSYLQGLSRILELLSHWFNVNLGDKLLEHLDHWTEPQKIVMLKRGAPGTESRIGAAIIDLFHLLPPAASKFVDALVYMVLKLECELGVAGPGVAHLGLKGKMAASTSPFRVPLLRFCNKHADAAIKFFLSNLKEPQIRHLFFVLLNADDANPLRSKLASEPKAIVASTFNVAVRSPAHSAFAFYGVLIVNAVYDDTRPQWLRNMPIVLSSLLQHWNSKARIDKLSLQRVVPMEQVQENRIMSEILIRYCENNLDAKEVLFHLLKVFSLRTECDFSFVKDFLARTVSQAYSTANKKAVLDQFLSFFADGSNSQEKKVHALQLIVIPMVKNHLEGLSSKWGSGLASGSKSNVIQGKAEDATAVSREVGRKSEPGGPSGHALPTVAPVNSQPGVLASGTVVTSTGLPPNLSDEVLDASTIHRIVKELLDRPDDVLRDYDEPLSAELLQLATLLIQYMPAQVGGFRKELIKFGWAHLKREDSIAKQWAFVNVSRFFEAYQAPPKIILQVYVALLRAVQGDGKHLVRQALDILTPALPRRLEHNPADKKCPIWIRYTKKVLLEEGHSIVHLVHIWQLIIRHAGLFYVARSQFVPIMVNTLARIGLQSSSTAPSAENRRVSLDLADLIISWKADRPYKTDTISENGSIFSAAKRRRMEGPASISAAGSASVLSSESQKTSLSVKGGNRVRSIRAVDVTQQSSTAPKNSGAHSSAQTIPAADRDDFQPSQGVLEMTVNFLTQVPFRPMERRERDIIANRCVLLIDMATELCPGVNVKFSNIERIVEITDKNPQQNASVSRMKPNQPTQVPAGAPAAAEAKMAAAMKAEAAKNEKMEAVRVEKILIRKAALKAALEMCVVLSRRQCVNFARNNTVALFALIAPSLSDRNTAAAKLFAELMNNLLRHIPTLRSQPRQVIAAKQTASHASGPAIASKPVEGVTKTSGNVGKPRPASLPSGVLLPSVTPRAIGGLAPTNTIGQVSPAAASGATMDRFYGVVLETIERCIRSDDLNVNHCGLIVLQALLAQRPEEFFRFRDILAKSFSRMVKENPQISQQVSGAANNGAGNSQTQKSGSNTNHSRTSGQEKSAASVASSGGNAGSARSNPVKGTGPSSEESAMNSSSKSAGQESATGSPNDGRTMSLCLSILGANISNLEATQRRLFIQGMCVLIERCIQVDVLLEIVRVIGIWVTWRSRPQSSEPGTGQSRVVQKDPLTPKEKSQFLLKMIVFERITGPGSQQLMNAFLDIILTVFGSKSSADRRPELLPKLERAFLVGLKSKNTAIRAKFFKLFDGALTRNPLGRLHYIISRQDWHPLAEYFWIKQAAELLVSAIDPKVNVCLESCSGRLPRIVEGKLSSDHEETKGLNPQISNHGSNEMLRDFLSSIQAVNGNSLSTVLRQMLNDDIEIAYFTWVSLFPAAWSLSSNSERANLETGLSSLLVKEYHIHQSTWPRNVVQALLDGASKCNPPPHIPPEVLFHLGSRWNAWHTALPYLNRRAEWLSSALQGASQVDNKARMRYEDELDSVLNASAEMYRRLNEKDFFAGVWKRRATCASTSEALALEQRGQISEAQELYSQCMLEYQAMFATAGNSADHKMQNGVASFPNPIEKHEVCLWEERWVVCAQHLCQWDILTEFSRSMVQSDLLHECLWRVPDWSALKELLYRQPVEDGPTLRFYQAYVHIQENKLETADNSVQHGYQKALERYCSLPQDAGPDSHLDVLVQFQQLVELHESSRILAELNALSRHGSGGVNVDQKIESVRSILVGWRERLPAPHEPLPVWNKILTWRNHVHAVVVNVLETLKDAADAKVAAAQNQASANTGSGRGVATQSPSSTTAQVQAAFAIAQSLPQQVLVMGVNETAWNIHRFARACRKQGQPNVAINALLKLYPFGTMELSEYFVKTKETAKSFMAGPSGLDNNLQYGLNELNRCNMDHFNARQKAQLFTMKGKFHKKLGKDAEVAESYSTALSISGDVASGWLAWAHHCDDLQKKENGTSSGRASLSVGSTEQFQWREAAVNCYLQAIRFGSRKARNYVPRTLRLLTEDIIARQKTASTRSSIPQTSSSPRPGRNSAESSVAPQATGTRPDAMQVDSNSPTSGSASTSSGTDANRLQKEGVVAVFANFVEVLPPWIWLPWLTQIITMLSRREAIVARAILSRVVPHYPQAVFFPLRAFMEERKSTDRPSRNLTAEALKSSRSNTSALLPAASNAQVTTAARHVQTLKEQVRVIWQKLQEKTTEQKSAETELVTAKRGTPEYDAASGKVMTLKEQVAVMRRSYQRALDAFRQAQQKQSHVQPQQPSQAQQAQAQPQASVSQGAATPSPQEQILNSNPQLPGSVSSPKPPNGKGRTSGSQVSPPVHIAVAGQAKSTQRQESGAQVSNRQSPQQARGPAGNSHPSPRTPYEFADQVMARLVKSHQNLYVDIERVAYSLAKRMKPHQEEQLLHLINALLHRCYQLSVQPGKEVAPSLRSALEDVSRMCFGTATKDLPPPPDFKIHPSMADLKPVFEAELAPQVSKDFPTRIEPFIARLRRWKSILQRRVDCLGATQNMEFMCRHLVEIHGSDVEVFGQYLMAEAVEISTDSLSTIDKFQADSVVVRRHSGAARGVYVLAKDGKEHRFILETSANAAVQPTEERAAQLCRLFNASFFAKHAEAQRRRTRIEVPKLIPTGHHTRLVSYDPHNSSLADGLEGYMEAQGLTLDDPLMAFRRIASLAFNRRRAESNGQAGEKLGREGSIAARVEAYHKVCKENVPETCLSDWLMSRIRTPNLLFAFRKKFAETLGSSSLICYALAVGARQPQNITFSWDTGAVCNLHVRPLVSPVTGVLECDEAVPFRLTRNIRNFLGPVGVNGPLFGSMAVTMEALRANPQLLRVYLDTILHDELAVWAPQRSSITSSGSQGSPVRIEAGSLEKRLNVSVENVLGRLDPARALPEGFNKEEVSPVTVLSHGINALIERAGKPENLAEMDSSWQAWF